MKANEFVKEHGFQYTRNLVRDYPNHTHVTDDGRMFINENTCASHIKVQLSELAKIDELKRIIESHELVALFDDINCAKSWVSDLDGDWPHQVKGADTKFFKLQLEQAIADVESCM